MKAITRAVHIITEEHDGVSSFCVRAMMVSVVWFWALYRARMAISSGSDPRSV